jgi:hypothetical protein
MENLTEKAESSMETVVNILDYLKMVISIALTHRKLSNKKRNNFRIQNKYKNKNYLGIDQKMEKYTMVNLKMD